MIYKGLHLSKAGFFFIFIPRSVAYGILPYKFKKSLFKGTFALLYALFFLEYLVNNLLLSPFSKEDVLSSSRASLDCIKRLITCGKLVSCGFGE